jgi:hypothetical protein
MCHVKGTLVEEELSGLPLGSVSKPSFRSRWFRDIFRNKFRKTLNQRDPITPTPSENS